MVDDNGIPASATRGAVSPSDALGELCIGVRKEELCEKRESMLQVEENTGGTHNIVAHSVHLAPCAHYKGVVECEDCNNIDTLLFQLGEVLNVAGDVIDGASGGKGACAHSFV